MMRLIPITTGVLQLAVALVNYSLVINERLVEFLDLRNTLSYFQIGFRRRYRTSDHVFIVNTVLNSYFHKGKKGI